MLEKITIARPYAQAVFEYARENNEVAQWSDLLQFLKLIVSDRDMQQLMHNPRVSERQLEELLAELCGDRLTDSGRNFIRILIDSDRLQYAVQINELYEAMRFEAEGKARVEVYSAYPLEAEQEQRISRAMARRLDKEIVISSVTDGKLIGGVIIRAGDSVIDASIRGRIDELRNELL